MKRSDDPVPNEANELMLAGIVPAQMVTATVALAKRPRMSREPCVIERRGTGITAAESLGKSDDIETNTRRIAEAEFVLAIPLKAVALVGDSVETPGAEPIAFRGR